MYVPTHQCPPDHGFSVQISSLPNHILSDAMMTATLEQAQLDMYVSSFTTQPGTQRGNALITFTSADAAMRCARHFDGRRWDSYGIPVSAWLLPAKALPRTHPAPAASRMNSFTLSAEAPEFVPGLALEDMSGKAASYTSPIIGSDVSTEDGESAVSSDEK